MDHNVQNIIINENEIPESTINISHIQKEDDVKININQNRQSDSKLSSISASSLNSSLISSSSLINQKPNLISLCLPDECNLLACKDSLSPMYRSCTSINSDDDPWKASSIGIKCISYKPIGYVFLTRRILDLYVTDGRRKIEILYNYSKKYRNRIKIPSIGSSIKNCSFCDTITLDFDPDSTLFDLVMEVQIITQGATIDRYFKLIAEPTTNSNEKASIIEHKSSLNAETIQESSQDVNKKSGEYDSDEETTLTSFYDFKIKKNTDSESNDNSIEILNLNSETNQTNDNIQKNESNNLSQNLQFESDVQKIIIRTRIKSEFDDSYSSSKSLSSSNLKMSNSINFGELGKSSKEDTFSLDSSGIGNSKSLRSISTLSLSGNSNETYNLKSKSQSSDAGHSSLSNSKRSIITTVEFHPPMPSYVELFDLANEDLEKKQFFDDFEYKYEQLNNVKVTDEIQSDKFSKSSCLDTIESDLKKDSSYLYTDVSKDDCLNVKDANNNNLECIDERLILNSENRLSSLSEKSENRELVGTKSSNLLSEKNENSIIKENINVNKNLESQRNEINTIVNEEISNECRKSENGVKSMPSEDLCKFENDDLKTSIGSPIAKEENIVNIKEESISSSSSDCGTAGKLQQRDYYVQDSYDLDSENEKDSSSDSIVTIIRNKNFKSNKQSNEIDYEKSDLHETSLDNIDTKTNKNQKIERLNENRIKELQENQPVKNCKIDAKNKEFSSLEIKNLAESKENVISKRDPLRKSISSFEFGQKINDVRDSKRLTKDLESPFEILNHLKSSSGSNEEQQDDVSKNYKNTQNKGENMENMERMYSEERTLFKNLTNSKEIKRKQSKEIKEAEINSPKIRDDELIVANITKAENLETGEKLRENPRDSIEKIYSKIKEEQNVERNKNEIYFIKSISVLKENINSVTEDKNEFRKINEKETIQITTEKETNIKKTNERSENENEITSKTQNEENEERLKEKVIPKQEIKIIKVSKEEETDDYILNRHINVKTKNLINKNQSKDKIDEILDNEQIELKLNTINSMLCKNSPTTRRGEANQSSSKLLSKNKKRKTRFLAVKHRNKINTKYLAKKKLKKKTAKMTTIKKGSFWNFASFWPSRSSKSESNDDVCVFNSESGKENQNDKEISQNINDISLNDYSKSELELDRNSNNTFSDLLRPNSDVAYFPIYVINDKLVKQSDINERKTLLGDAKNEAVFDITSSWNKEYTDDYINNSTNNLSVFDQFSKEESVVVEEKVEESATIESEKVQDEQQLRVRDLINFASFWPSRSSKSESNDDVCVFNSESGKENQNDKEISQNINDISLNDYSKSELELDRNSNNTFSDLLRPNSDVAYFPIYVINDKLVKQSDINERKTLLGDAKKEAVFDITSSWNKEYTDDYINNSTNNLSIFDQFSKEESVVVEEKVEESATIESEKVQDEQQLRVRDLINFASFWPSRSSKSESNDDVCVFNSESGKENQNDKEISQNINDISLNDYSKSELELDRNSNNTFSDLLRPNSDVAYFPIYVINDKLVKQSDINERKTLLGDAKNEAVFDITSSWNKEYTDDYINNSTNNLSIFDQFSKEESVVVEEKVEESATIESEKVQDEQQLRVRDLINFASFWPSRSSKSESNDDVCVFNSESGKENQNDKEISQNINDISLNDYSKSELELDRNSNNTFSDLLRPNSDVAYFPIYVINDKLVKQSDINERKTLLGDAKNEAVFDITSSWNKEYTDDYINNSTNNLSVFDQFSKEESVVVEEKVEESATIESEKVQDEQQLRVRDLINFASFWPSRSSKSESNDDVCVFNSESGKENQNDKEISQNINDISLNDYSKSELELDRNSNNTFSDLLRPNSDVAYFPIYVINDKLVKQSDINERKTLLGDAKKEAVFDITSSWNKEYTDDYINNSTNNLSIFDQFSKEESVVVEEKVEESATIESEKVQDEQQLRVRDLINFASFWPSRSSKSESNDDVCVFNSESGKENQNDKEISQNINDISLNDYSKSELELDRNSNNTFSDLLRPNSDVAYFPIYVINDKLVKQSDINERKTLLGDAKNEAVFDITSSWNKEYTDDYINNSTNNLSIFDQFSKEESVVVEEKVEESATIESEKVQDEQQLRVRDLINFASFWPSRSSKSESNDDVCVFNSESGKENQNDKEISQNINDISLNDYSKSELELDRNSNNTFSDLLRPNSDVAYFPIYVINDKLVKQSDINERKTLLGDAKKEAVFDITSSWNKEYTDDYINNSTNNLSIFDQFSKEESVVVEEKVEESATIESEKVQDEQQLRVRDLINFASFWPSRSSKSESNDDVCVFNSESGKENQNDKEISQNINDISLNDYSKSELELDRNSNNTFSDLLRPNSDVAYFPIYVINDKLVKQSDINERKTLLGDAKNEAVFDITSSWNKEYTDDYINNSTNNLSVFDQFSKEESVVVEEKVEESATIESEKVQDEQQLRVRDLINFASFWPSRSSKSESNDDVCVFNSESGKENQNDKEISQNINDISLNDYSKSELELDRNSNNTFSDLLRPNSDVAYFPIYVINDKLVKQSDINERKTLLGDAKNEAVFDITSSWNKEYTDDYINNSTDNLSVFDQFSKEESVVVEEKVEESATIESEKVQDEQQLRVRDLINFASFWPSRSSKSESNDDVCVFNSESGKENQNDKEISQNVNEVETVLSLEPYKLNSPKIDIYRSLCSHFYLSELSQVRELYQDSFTSASLRLDNVFGILKNYFDTLPSPPNGLSAFEYIDIVRLQNLKMNKPYFDDFAVFPNQYYEYSQYHLVSNSSRFDFLNSIQRTGTPFFYIYDKHQLSEYLQKNGFTFSDVFGFFIITIGAVSLFSFTFV